MGQQPIKWAKSLRYCTFQLQPHLCCQKKKAVFWSLSSEPSSISSIYLWWRASTIFNGFWFCQHLSATEFTFSSWVIYVYVPIFQGVMQSEVPLPRLVKVVFSPPPTHWCLQTFYLCISPPSLVYASTSKSWKPHISAPTEEIFVFSSNDGSFDSYWDSCAFDSWALQERVGQESRFGKSLTFWDSLCTYQWRHLDQTSHYFHKDCNFIGKNHSQKKLTFS